MRYRDGSIHAMLPPMAVGGDVRVVESDERRDRLAEERALDLVLADSFPASDPPSWTLGVARPKWHGDASADSGDSRVREDADPAPATIGVVDVALPRYPTRSLLQRLGAVAGAAGLALLAPLAILLVGLPIALAVRGLVEAVSWLLARLVA